MRLLVILALGLIGLATTQARAEQARAAQGRADWDLVTRVDLDRGYNRAYGWNRFQGPVDRLRFVARRDDVQCRRIVAIYGDGTRQIIVTGRINENRSRIVDFNRARRIQSLEFICRSRGAGDGRLRVEADYSRGRGGFAGDVRRERFRAVRDGLFGNEWTRIGRVTFGQRLEREIEYTDFPGRVASLRFRARGSSLLCRRVYATFANGSTRNIFSGIIREGGSREVRFSRDRRVRALTFICQAERRDRGTLVISGKYDDIRGSGIRTGQWVRLGQSTFGRRTEVERTFSRFNTPITRLGLRPLDDDARCSRIRVTFESGRSRDLPFGQGVLREERLYAIDLPGDQRRVRSITMACRAVAARDATIAVYGIRDRTTRLDDDRRRGGGGGFSGGRDFDDRRDFDDGREFDDRRDFDDGRDSDGRRARDDRRDTEPGWTSIGRVRVGERLGRTIRYTNIPNGITELRLRARGSSIRCNRITAGFANGGSRNIFSGILPEDNVRVIRFRNDRRLRVLNFDCQSSRGEGGVVVISGRRSSGGRVDDRRARDAGPDWVRLGAARFGSRNEVERRFTGFSGPIRRLGLRAVDDSARCSRIYVTFNNGRTRDLPFGRGVLQEGRLYTLDLPGDQRRVRRVTMICRAVRARDATIAIFGVR